MSNSNYILQNDIYFYVKPETTCCHFEVSAICLYLLEKTLKAIGPFYLVSMPGDVKDPTQGANV